MKRRSASKMCIDPPRPRRIRPPGRRARPSPAWDRFPGRSRAHGSGRCRSDSRRWRITEAVPTIVASSPIPRCRKPPALAAGTGAPPPPRTAGSGPWSRAACGKSPRPGAASGSPAPCRPIRPPVASSSVLLGHGLSLLPALGPVEDIARAAQESRLRASTARPACRRGPRQSHRLRPCRRAGLDRRRPSGLETCEPVCGDRLELPARSVKRSAIAMKSPADSTPVPTA